MSVVAGVDVGNATTEVVLVGDDGVLASGRVRTRGDKGSPRSIEGAAELIRRLADGEHVDEVAIAPLRPVTTATLVIPDPPPDTGALRVISTGVATPYGRGVAVGRAWRPETPAAAGDRALVAVIDDHLGFRQAAALLQGEARVVAVIASADEAVLIGRRLGAAIPIIDQVDTHLIPTGQLLACEVSNGALARLTDPLWLASSLAATTGDAAATAALLRDASCGIVALDAQSPPGAAIDPRPSIVASGQTLILPQPEQPVGTVTAVISAESTLHTSDARWIAVSDVTERVLARRSRAGHELTLATLADEPAAHVADLLAYYTSLPCREVGTEAAAARRGALTTPGAGADVIVVDIGAGTIDIIGDRETVAAGAGDLLTAVVASLLPAPRSLAEHAKRAPARLAVTSQLVETEDGRRSFLTSPLPGAHVGHLLVDAPAGRLPLPAGRPLAEWRALRRAAKTQVLGGGVRRALAGRDGTLLLVGGPAGDDEALTAVADATGLAVGRGDIAGLGHRFAVAYGLACMARDRD